MENRNLIKTNSKTPMAAASQFQPFQSFQSFQSFRFVSQLINLQQNLQPAPDPAEAAAGALCG